VHGDQAGRSPADRKPFDLGFLFVHGIGTQQRGQTLAEFATPLVHWLKLRCDAASDISTPSDLTRVRALKRAGWDTFSRTTAPAVDSAAEAPTTFRVEVRDVQSTSPSDSSAPAHATLTLVAADRQCRTTTEQWLMAESWWAASFGVPSFRNLARWGLGVLPWIVGSHCAAQVRRRFREPLPTFGMDTSLAYASGVWGRASAVGGLVSGIVISSLLQPLLAVFLLLSAVPIPTLRKALLGLQLRIAAVLGDCYVLLERPVESASIVSQVRRDLRWLATRCSEVVVVAHSQGGAAAHLALRTDVPGELRLLFTFGSGLRKLEEARGLAARGSSFAFSAAITAIAMLLLLAMVALWVGAWLAGASQRPASVVTAIIWIVLTGAVCAFGIRDHLRGISLPELVSWIAHVGRQPWRWRDCYASGDPVPNGVVLRRAKRLTHEVCNRNSMVDDHTTYWANLDEFVSTLFDEVADARRSDGKSRDPLSFLRVSARARDAIAAHRRWRAFIGRTIHWTALAGAVGVIRLTSPALSNLIQWAWIRGTEWLPRELGMTAANPPEFAIDWTAIGWFALIVVPYAVVRGVWLSWDQSEMSAALLGSRAHVSRDAPISTVTGLWFLALLSAGVWLEELPSFWIWMATLGGLMVIFLMEPSKPKVSEEPGHGNAGGSAPRRARRFTMTSGVETLLTRATGLFSAATFPFLVGLLMWQVFSWLVDWLAP
jgi:hypothetical protein